MNELAKIFIFTLENKKIKNNKNALAHLIENRNDISQTNMNCI